MPLKFPSFTQALNVSLKEFILNGTFDHVKLGVTKSWLASNFMEPEETMGPNNYRLSAIQLGPKTLI